MRKTINISALILFIWLLLGAFNLPGMLLNFLLVGEIPGTTLSLSPTQMLAILTAVTGLVVFEILSRRVSAMRRIRNQILAITRERELPPRRRLNRV